MLRLSQFFVLTVMCFCLLGCHHYSRYTRYFQHPDKLKQAIAQCKDLGIKAKQKPNCVNAFVVAMVLNHFLALQNRHSQQFILAREKLRQLQQRLSKDQNNTALQQQLIQQQNKLQRRFVGMMTLVQEDFAKLIMQTETRLSQLKQEKSQLLEKLKQVATESKQNIEAKVKIIKERINLQKRLVEAMLAFVSLASGG